MSTGSSAQPATDSAAGRGSSAPSAAHVSPSRERRGFPRLRDARIRSKLALILFVPLAAVLALAGVRLFDVGSQALAAAEVEELTRLSTDVSGLTHALHRERMAAAQFLSAGAGSSAADYEAAIAQSDARIQEYTANRRDLDEPPAAIVTRLNRIDDHLRSMDLIRGVVTDREQIEASEAVLRYGVVITDMVGYSEVVGQVAGDGEVADGLRALAAFTKAQAGTAEQQAISFAASVSGPISQEQQAAFIATQTAQQEALEDFSLVASPAQRDLVDNTVSGDAVNLADQTALRLSRGERVNDEVIDSSLGAVVDLMRWAEQLLEAQSVDAAADESAAVTRQATIEAIAVLLVLVIAVALAIILARSLNLSLRRLREGALSVANRDLPEAVARLRDVRNLGDGGPEDIVRQVRDPIQLNNRDEVGQVAQAFNVVHREAVRVAAEQAALRTSVSAMFLNLARRSQSLVDRMIGELDQIERGEEDPKRLAQLFELDHLATRMRRNDENLLVLAGADSSAPRREDALMVDALRAAQSEVELYNRIEFGTVDTDISIAALAVNDVVRLVAELLDNATRFSPPNTVVVADGRRIRDYVVIQIEDRGLGMSEEQMETLNRRLAEPPSVDVGAFRLMGLAVVGRLADRYGIRVELRANMEGGTIAQVVLPNSIVILPNRPVDPRGGRMAQLDSAPSGSWDAMPSGRTATATLPSAVAPEPAWRAELPQRANAFDATPARSQPYESQPYESQPYESQPYESHPSLPQMPSQRPQPNELPPTVDRPPLPTRVAQPVGETPSAGGRPAFGAVAETRSPAPSTFAGAPTGLAGAPQDNALGSPTVAYPTLAPAATPELQVAVGFVTPDGRKIPPPAQPASPPSGWGAALAAMPPAPPPPDQAPVEEKAEAPIFLQMQASWFKVHDGVGPEEWTMPTAGFAPPPVAASVSGAPAASTSAAPASPAPARPAQASPAPASPAPARPAAAAGYGSGGHTSATPAAASMPSRAASTSYSDTRTPNNPPPAAAPPAPPLPKRNPATANGATGSGSGQNGARPAPAGRDTGGPSVPRQRDAAEDHWRTRADEGWQRAMAAAEPPDAGTTRSGLPKRVPQAQLVPGGVESAARNQNKRSPDEVRGLLSAYHRGVQRGRTAGSAEAAATGSPAPKENTQ